ncbi:dihydrofolate reductase family protein [Agromyces endophyticus]|uniref:dihydrofolate reductase family protein n=1 Tax=Agromyces sp. H17E-10 TaxID=2932244 RepID=UPI001FD47B38|nr:dihydrofolate reductase family protein [Agromyces sp. H17E-10]UOQ90808.1 dihydrofolate reductase family protein [Agromyces sp. H17E-10]
MSHVFLEMTMTLDGFTAAHGVSLEHPLGIDGERVHEWIRNSVFSGAVPQSSDAVVDTEPARIDREARERMFESTGAFVLGRRTFDVGEAAWGDAPVFEGRPCFVVTSREHEPVECGGSRFEFVTGGVREAVARASEAASAASVCIMGGARVARDAFAEQLVDEARLHLVPVLLGGGARLFPDAAEHRIELDPLSVAQGAKATHLRYRVVRDARPT